MPLCQELDEIYVIIPCAGNSKDALGHEIDYPATLRYIDGRPFLFRIVENLSKQGMTNFRIGVKKDFKNLCENALIFFENLNIQFIEVNDSKSEVETISKLVANLSPELPILVNFGDTLCEFELDELLGSPFGVVASIRADSSRWTKIETNDDGYITKVRHKQLFEKEELSEVLCGVYWFSQLETMTKLIVQGKESMGEIVDCKAEETKVLHAEKWFDSDHLDVYQESLSNNLRARHFNEVHIDVESGVLIKKSIDIKKLSNEVNYYRMLPERLKPLFPRMFSYEITKETASQTLEYFPLKSLSEIFTQNNVPNYVWTQIFKRLNRITFGLFADSLEAQLPRMENFYVDKLIERLEVLSMSKEFDKSLLEQDFIMINNYAYQGIRKVIDEARLMLSTNFAKRSLVHGDFCFSNILYDPNSGIVKLIDPRGSFGTEMTLYGPQSYDIAKLSHSVLGLYDFFIAGQFTVNKVDANWTLKIGQPQNYSEIRNCFYQEYVKDYCEPEEAELLSACLLLSLIPLHLDDKIRAEGLFLRGIVQANEAFRALREKRGQG